MNKSMLIGAVLGGAGALSVGAVGSYLAFNKAPQYAEVLSVEPVERASRTPEKECHDVQVTHRKPVTDENRIAGTVIGGVLGAVVGHQVGQGRGNAVATVAGAAAGGYAGNRVQKQMQDKDSYSTTEQRCTTTNRVSEKVIGYDVKYRLDGRVSTVRMDHDPGERIPVRNGRLLVTQSDTGARVN